MTSTETPSLPAAALAAMTTGTRTGAAGAPTYAVVAATHPGTREARPARGTTAMISRIRSWMITSFYAAGPVAFVIVETAGSRHP